MSAVPSPGRDRVLAICCDRNRGRVLIPDENTPLGVSTPSRRAGTRALPDLHPAAPLRFGAPSSCGRRNQIASRDVGLAKSGLQPWVIVRKNAPESHTYPALAGCNLGGRAFPRAAWTCHHSAVYFRPRSKHVLGFGDNGSRGRDPSRRRATHVPRTKRFAPTPSAGANGQSE